MNLTTNEANWDRIGRVVLALVLFVAGLSMGGFGGVLAIVFGVVFLVTGIVGFCPLYRLFGMSTCPVK
jgi:hypothetical protein